MITLALLSHSRHFFLFNQVVTYWARSFWLSVNASAHKSWIDATLLRGAPTSYLSHQLQVWSPSFQKTTKYPGRWAFNSFQPSPTGPFVKDNRFNPTKQTSRSSNHCSSSSKGLELFCHVAIHCRGFSAMLTFSVWQLVKWVPAHKARTLAALFINICTTGHRAG